MRLWNPLVRDQVADSAWSGIDAALRLTMLPMIEVGLQLRHASTILRHDKVRLRVIVTHVGSVTTLARRHINIVDARVLPDLLNLRQNGLIALVDFNIALRIHLERGLLDAPRRIPTEVRVSLPLASVQHLLVLGRLEAAADPVVLSLLP